MYTATYEVNLMMQAFLENGGKTGGDIIHYASVIKEEIKCLPDSEAKSKLSGLLSNLIGGSPLMKGFVATMREVGLVRTGVYASWGGTSSSGERFVKLERGAQLAHDVELLEGNVKHRTKPAPKQKRITRSMLVIAAIEKWERENVSGGRFEKKPPEFQEFCDMVGKPSFGTQGGKQTEDARATWRELHESYNKSKTSFRSARMTS
jgi:hypothetical protein